MARKLGYGGIGNTNGARDFSGKASAGVDVIALARSIFRFTFGRLFGRVN